MKKINYIIITMLFAFVISLPGTVNACSPGSVVPIGSYVVYDQSADNTNTYRVYVYVSDECPSQSSGVQTANLSASQLGTYYNISSTLQYLNLPTDQQSYLYFKIHIVVQKYSNGATVGNPVTRYSYADYDSAASTFTARTQPIAVSF